MGTNGNFQEYMGQGGYSRRLFLSRTSDPRLVDVRLEGSRLTALVDGAIWTIVLPDDVLSALDSGKAGLEVLALRFVAFSDALRQDFSSGSDQVSFT